MDLLEIESRTSPTHGGVRRVRDNQLHYKPIKGKFDYFAISRLIIFLNLQKRECPAPLT